MTLRQLDTYIKKNMKKSVAFETKDKSLQRLIEHISAKPLKKKSKR